MYADGTTVTFSAENTASLEFQVKKELASLENWLIANRLSLNISKLSLCLLQQDKSVRLLMIN